MSGLLTTLPNVDRSAAAVATIAGLASYTVARMYVSNRLTNPDVYDAPVPSGLLNRFFFLNTTQVFGKDEACQWKLKFSRDAVANGKKATRTRATVLSSAIEPTEPQDVEYILLTNGLNYTKQRSVYDTVKLILGDHGLVTLTDEADHAIQRRAVNPSFSPAAVKKIGDSVISQHVADLVRHLEKDARSGATSDLGTEYDHLALGIIAEAAFKDEDAGTSTVSDLFREVTNTLFTNRLVFLPGSRYFMRKARQTLFDQRERILQVCRRVNAARKEYLTRAQQHSETAGDSAKSVHDRQLFADFLVTSPDLTPDMVASHTLTFLFAGHETTATVLNWASCMLASHPDVQEALFEELAGVVPLGGVPDHDSLDQCKLLNAVINETLRLFPPGPGFGRTAEKDDVLPSGLVIEAGTTVEVPVFTIQRDPRVWGPDADEFVPSRWDDPARMAAVGPGSYLPFLQGKRNCIGKEFALMELRVTLAAVVRRFDITIKAGARAPKRQMFLTMRTDYAVPFVLRLREK